MTGDAFEFLRAAFQNEEGHADAYQVRRAGHGNFRVAADDNGISVMSRMAPAPGGGFADDHEGRDFVNDVVHPRRAKGSAMSAFVPARVGCRAVEQAVSDEKWHAPPCSPEVVTEEAS